VAEHSETPLLQKLGIKEGTRMVAVNPPADFRANLGDLPLAVEWANRVRPPLDLIVAFHTKRSALLANWPTLIAAAAPGAAIWIAWPKKASGVATDIDDNVLREELLPSGWVDNKVCAIDETWSGLRFVLRTQRRGRTSSPAAKPAKLRKTRPGSHR
jgi:hypothetical protein